MIRKLALSSLLTITVLASAAPSFAKVNEYEGQHRNTAQASVLAVEAGESEGSQTEETDLLTRKVNEYEGQHLTEESESLLTRKVNEYEGQH